MMNQEQVSKSKFKAKALEFFRQVECSGESLIVTNHGKPSIEIRPYRTMQGLPLDILKGSVTEYIDPTEPVGESDWKVLS